MHHAVEAKPNSSSNEDNRLVIQNMKAASNRELHLAYKRLKRELESRGVNPKLECS